MEVPEEGPSDRLNPAAGFEISPFSSAIISLKFADGLPLTIHRSILLRSSNKLGLLLDSSTKTINLSGFSGIAGHALVSYLYSEDYGLLKWTGPFNPAVDTELVKLKVKFEIYALARTIELDDLEEQVRDEIERTADYLDIFTVIDAVKATYPTQVGNDTWFPPWIKSLVKKAFKDPRKLSKIPLAPDFGDGFSVVKFLLGCMLETHAEMQISLASQEVAATDLDLVEPGSAATNSPFEDAGADEDSGQPQDPLIILKSDRHPAEPILPGPQVSDEERELLRATLADRKLPVWWTALQVHNTCPPPRTDNHRPEPSPKMELGPEPELALETEPEPFCEEQVRFEDIETRLVEEAPPFNQVLCPEDEPEPAPEPEQKPVPELAQEETFRGIDLDAILEMVKHKEKSFALTAEPAGALEPEPEPEPELEARSDPEPELEPEPAPELEQKAEAVTSWNGFSQLTFESNTVQQAVENGGYTSQRSPSHGEISLGVTAKKKKKKGKKSKAIEEAPEKVKDSEDAVELERDPSGF